MNHSDLQAFGLGLSRVAFEKGEGGNGRQDPFPKTPQSFSSLEVFSGVWSRYKYVLWVP